MKFSGKSGPDKFFFPRIRLIKCDKFVNSEVGIRVRSETAARLVELKTDTVLSAHYPKVSAWTSREYNSGTPLFGRGGGYANLNIN